MNVRIEKRYVAGNKIDALNIYLDTIGEKILFNTTQYHIGDKLAFIVNDRLIDDPIIVSTVANGKIPINPNIYSLKELELLEEVIKKEIVDRHTK